MDMIDLNSRALQKASKGGRKNITLAAPPDFALALDDLATRLNLKKSFLIRYLVYEKLDLIDELDSEDSDGRES